MIPHAVWRREAPDKAELESLVHTFSKRVGRYLESQGVLVRDRPTTATSPWSYGMRPI